MLIPIKIVNGEQNKSNVIQDVNFGDFEFLSGKVSYGDSYIDGHLLSEGTISHLLESKKVQSPTEPCYKNYSTHTQQSITLSV